MGKIFLYLFLIVTSAILSIWLYLKFSLVDISDFVVTKSIPQYPNSTSWKLDSSKGFPDGDPAGSIRFYSSDSAQSVINFYESALLQKGWSIKQLKPDINNPVPADAKKELFIKSIDKTNFVLSIEKGLTARSEVNIRITHER